MTKDDLIQMARDCAKQAGFDEFAKTLNAPQSLDAGDLLIKMTAHVANAILERAAMECEDTDIEEARGGTSYYAQLGDAGATRDSIASAIRALKIPEGE